MRDPNRLYNFYNEVTRLHNERDNSCVGKLERGFGGDSGLCFYVSPSKRNAKEVFL